MFFTLSNPNGVPGGDPFDMIQQKKDDADYMASKTAALAMSRGQDPVMARDAGLPLRPKDDPDNYAPAESEILADNDLQNADLGNMSPDELGSRPGLLLNMAARTLYDYRNKTGSHAEAFPETADISGLADLSIGGPDQETKRPRFTADMAELAIAKEQMDAGRQRQQNNQSAADAMTNDDFSQLGVELGGALYWNDVAQLLAYANIGQVPPEVEASRLFIMQLYDSLPNGTWKGTGRAAEHILSSPLTWVGAGSLGGMRNLFRGATAKGVTGLLKEKLLKSFMGSAWVAGISTEGAAYGSMANFLHQRLLWDDEVQGPFQLDVDQLKNAALIGGGLGAGLGGAIIGATKVVQKTAQAVKMWPTKQRIGAMAGGDGSVTMGAGYPFAGVDHVIPTEAATDLSPAGFYSAVGRAVDTLPQEKGAASQMRAMIAKGEGVKAEEMAWIGLDDFLKGRKNVTKQEIADFVDANQVEVVQITKDLDQAAAREESMLLQEQHKAGEITDAELLAGEKAISARQAKFGPPSESVNLPGGENYREVLLTLPEQPVSGARYAIKGADGNNVSSNATTREEAIAEAGGDASRVIEIRGNDTVNPNFTAGHMNEPNVLAWVRMDDRIGPNGERILFLQEVQSDWHQKGRELRVAEIKRIAEKNNITKEEAAKLVPDDFGYANPEKLARLKEQRAKILAKRDDATPDWWPRLEELTDKRVTESLAELTPAERDEYLSLVAKREVFDKATVDALKEIDSQIASLVGSVPDAPFKKTWHEMSLRRVIRMAAEEGYDSVAWTPGKIQAERYDLSRQVDAVRIEKIRGGEKDGQYFVRGRSGASTEPFFTKAVPEKKLPDLIGKDLAEKAIKEAPKYPNGTEYTGVDLQVGGEGMRGFYDKMLTAFAAKFGKKFGAKVKVTKIQAGESTYNVFDESGVLASNVTEGRVDEVVAEYSRVGGTPVGKVVQDDRSHQVWTLSITPKMRDSVLKKGVPLFSAAGAATATGAVLSEQGTEPAS
jgi:hypothetical protein